ncbi:hypothetical protein [Kitasatospora sp. NBC_01539]|uniref:hypothetical protein n=1 Tax=Kitasatospora sp. NBC_01539 TaxID=2903577 RepID=UPI00386015C8
MGGGVLLVGSGAVPASASAPAGDVLDITAAHTAGSVLTWSGTFSCDTLLAATLTVHAVDTDGHSGTSTAAVLCPATGQTIGGAVGTGLLGLGGTWGERITVTATLRDVLLTPLATNTSTLVDNHLDEISVDGDAVTGNSVQLNGTFTCDDPSRTRMTIVTDLVVTGPGGASSTGHTTVSVPCPTDPDAEGTWSTAVPLVAATSPAAAQRAQTSDDEIPHEFAGSGFMFSVGNLVISQGSRVKMFNRDSDNVHVPDA